MGERVQRESVNMLMACCVLFDMLINDHVLFFFVSQMLNQENVARFCDVSWSVLEALASRTNQPVRHVAFVVAFLRAPMTWDMLSALSPAFVGFNAPPRTVRRWVSQVGQAAIHVPQPRIRFGHHDEQFGPCVTACVDGTTVRCRCLRKVAGAADETYSGHKKCHCWKFELFCTMNGTPFFFRGPFPGSRHDAAVYRSGGEMPHYRFERFLGDLGYVSCPHILHGWRKNDEPESLEEECMRQVVDDAVKRVRSRVERYFAFADKFHVLWQTDFHESAMKSLFAIVVAIMYLEDIEPLTNCTYRYPTVVTTPHRGLHTYQPCNCSMNGAENADLVIGVRAERGDFGDMLVENGFVAVETKKCRKRKRL